LRSYLRRFLLRRNDKFGDNRGVKTTQNHIKDILVFIARQRGTKALCGSSLRARFTKPRYHCDDISEPSGFAKSSQIQN
jgi:hypothetical protein